MSVNLRNIRIRNRDEPCELRKRNNRKRFHESTRRLRVNENKMDENNIVTVRERRMVEEVNNE